MKITRDMVKSIILVTGSTVWLSKKISRPRKNWFKNKKFFKINFVNYNSFIKILNVQMTVFFDYLLLLIFAFTLSSGLFLTFRGIQLI